MHVALAIPHLGGGGAERSTLALARGLLSLGYTVDLLLLQDKIVLKQEVPAEARLFVLSRNQRTSRTHILQLVRKLGLASFLLLRGPHLRHASSIAAYLDQERPHVLLPTLPDAKIASLLALFFACSRPLVVPIMRNNLMNRSRRSRILYRSLFGQADHIVAISSGLAESLPVGLGVSSNLVTVIYNPTFSKDLIAKADKLPDHPWFSVPGPPIILAAGRLARVKDFPTLIRAFEIALRNRPLRLLILGEGSWRQRLEHMIRKKGLAELVSLPGWVDNPFAYMRRAAVFVVSSKHEGLCGVLIQALACGCPSVSTDCPFGPGEVLDDGRIGPLVPVGDHQALADAIEQTLDAPPEPGLLTKRAQDFSHEDAISRYDALLRKLTAPPAMHP